MKIELTEPGQKNSLEHFPSSLDTRSDLFLNIFHSRTDVSFLSDLEMRGESVISMSESVYKAECANVLDNFGMIET